MRESTQTPQISQQDFKVLGMNDLAYIRGVEVDGASAFAVHAADGRQVAVLPSREQAYAAVLQHQMTPVEVH